MQQLQVRQAAEQYKAHVELDTDGSVTVDLSNVDFQDLHMAVVDEYNCGADGSIFDVLMDLADTVGLTEFGFVYEEQ